MTKHLFLLVVSVFLAGGLICTAQPDAATRNKGTLSGTQSSGGGQGGGCGYTIVPTSDLLCMDSVKTLSLNYIFSGNNDFPTPAVQLKIYSADSIFVDSSFNTQLLFDSANESIVVNKPGTYYFDLNVPGDPWIDDLGNVHPGPAYCHAEWVVTSTIPIPIPQQTALCTGGSATLQAPGGIAASYQWYDDNGLIAGQTSNTYLTSASGNYYVQTTDSNDGCVLNSDKINITIYPPPSQQNITGSGATNGTLTLDNSSSGLNPQSITWFRDGSPIKSFDDNGMVVAGGNGQGNNLNQFDQPYGIFLDSLQNIYVADYNNYRIMKWTPGSSIGIVFADNINQSGGNPTDVLLDSTVFYVSTTQNVLQFSPSLVISSLFNYNAWGLSVDSKHNIYFANDGNADTLRGGGIYKTDSTGKVAGDGQLGTGLSSINFPNGVYVDAFDNYYVADNLTDSANNYYGRIEKWAPGAVSGQLVAGGNGYGTAPNQIWFGAGITFDKSGNMYTTDPINNRIQLWKPGASSGITIAGGFTPWGIKVDDSSYVYVADQTNNQVLKFTPLLVNSIIADAPGIYKAIVTYPGGCSVTTADFIVSNPLPVTILNLKGQLNGDNAELTWQTASEFNSSYFSIQRSINGISFNTIGKIKASGNSSTLQNYLYNDSNVVSLNAGTVYYRLKETDVDGATAQSNIISIDIKKFGWNLSVNQNPVKDLLKVRLDNLYGNTDVLLIDLAGRKLSRQQVNASGNEVLNFNTHNLSAGLYIIRVTNKGLTKNLKFLKE